MLTLDLSSIWVISILCVIIIKEKTPLGSFTLPNIDRECEVAKKKIVPDMYGLYQVSYVWHRDIRQI